MSNKPYTTTLNEIREHRPCQSGWIKLLTHLNKVSPDDEPLLLTTVFASNGLQDTLWCLRVFQDRDQEIRKLACDFALQVSHLWNMPDIVRRYLETRDPSIRMKARDAAYAAYANAAYATIAAAYAAISSPCDIAAYTTAYATTDPKVQPKFEQLLLDLIK